MRLDSPQAAPGSPPANHGVRCLDSGPRSRARPHAISDPSQSPPTSNQRRRLLGRISALDLSQSRCRLAVAAMGVLAASLTYQRARLSRLTVRMAPSVRSLQRQTPSLSYPVLSVCPDRRSSTVMVCYGDLPPSDTLPAQCPPSSTPVGLGRVHGHPSIPSKASPNRLNGIGRSVPVACVFYFILVSYGLPLVLSFAAANIVLFLLSNSLYLDVVAPRKACSSTPCRVVHRLLLYNTNCRQPDTNSIDGPSKATMCFVCFSAIGTLVRRYNPFSDARWSVCTSAPVHLYSFFFLPVFCFCLFNEPLCLWPLFA